MIFADEPNTTYLAADSLSEELLKSIPNKVFSWLDNLSSSADREIGEHGNLKWDFSSETNTIQYGEPNGDELYVQFWWEGGPTEPENIRSSSENLEDISRNMDVFVRIEESIYGELESLQELEQE